MSHRNKVLSASALHLIACTRRVPTAREGVAGEAPPSQVSVPGTLRAQSPLGEGDMVTDAHFARNVLFTWTTQDQITELRRDRVLLSRSESAVHGASFFDQTMDSQAATGDRVAALLRVPSFRRARFAWVNPWATVRGWEGEHYGTSLLRVTLKAEAWVARFNTRTRTWALHDMQDRQVDLSELARESTRLAAVYFVHDLLRSPADPMGSIHGQGGAPYREYVLCNESMIESWEFGTETLRSELVASVGLTRSLADAMRESGAARRYWPRESTARWRDPCGSDPVIDGYLAAIAFLNDRYLPRTEMLEAVTLALEAALSLPDSPALVHRPADTPRPSLPPRQAPRGAPPASPPPRRTSLGGTY